MACCFVLLHQLCAWMDGDLIVGRREKRELCIGCSIYNCGDTYEWVDLAARDLYNHTRLLALDFDVNLSTTIFALAGSSDGSLSISLFLNCLAISPYMDFDVNLPTTIFALAGSSDGRNSDSCLGRMSNVVIFPNIRLVLFSRVCWYGLVTSPKYRSGK
nr:hypothetical protein [Tanacetum cinerariifolium]